MAFYRTISSSFSNYNITAVQDRSNMSLDRLKRELKENAISTINDEILEQYLQAAKEDADWYLNNPFTGPIVAGVQTQLPIPQRVESWVLKEAARLFQIDNGVDSESSPHVANTKWNVGPDYTLINKWRINPGF